MIRARKCIRSILNFQLSELQHVLGRRVNSLRVWISLRPEIFIEEYLNFYTALLLCKTHKSYFSFAEVFYSVSFQSYNVARPILSGRIHVYTSSKTTRRKITNVKIRVKINVKLRKPQDSKRMKKKRNSYVTHEPRGSRIHSARLNAAVETRRLLLFRWKIRKSRSGEKRG